MNRFKSSNTSTGATAWHYCQLNVYKMLGLQELVPSYVPSHTMENIGKQWITIENIQKHSRTMKDTNTIEKCEILMNYDDLCTA